MKKEKINPRLRDFKDKYEKSFLNYSGERDAMKKRLEVYKGTHKVRKGNDVDIVWNFTYELIESQVDSYIPAPKVTPQKPTDRGIRNAQVIEDMIRNEVNRMPFEAMNDEDERNTKIFGGSGYLVEWDNKVSTPDAVGALSVRLLSAMQIIPQYGVLETRYMDMLFVTFDDTKSRIKARYGKDVENETTDPQTSEYADTDDTVTQVVCYYKSKNGNIGCISWVNDVILIDDENFEARKDDICVKCGRAKVVGEKKCTCGSKVFEKRPLEFEEVADDITLSDGRVVSAISPETDENGEYIQEEYQEQEIDQETGLPVMDYVFENGVPIGDTPRMATAYRPKMTQTKIPLYYPKTYPVVIRKNVSAYNKFLGDSDIDVIMDFQEGANKLLSKAQKKILKSGSYITMLEKTKAPFTDEDIVPIKVQGLDEIQAIKGISASFDTSQDAQTAESYYYKAKSILGITDTYQGKADTTATSGKAKEIQVAQAAGRQKSKRTMKNAFYADLYEAMFKFMLAYADEPRTYTSMDENGKQVERIFNKYDFLEQDEFGNWYFCDEYLFSVDESGVDSNNKQFMLEDVRTDFKMGAFGNPQDPATMLRYWREKEVIGYPNAKRNVKEWEKIVEEQKQMQEMAMQQQSMQSDFDIDSFIDSLPEETQQQALDNPQMLEQLIAEQMGAIQ